MTTDIEEAVAEALKEPLDAFGHLEVLPDARKLLADLETRGLAVVPVEPTVAMLDAAIDVDAFKLGDISPLGFRCSPQQLFEQCYAAMINAASQ